MQLPAEICHQSYPVGHPWQARQQFEQIRVTWQVPPDRHDRPHLRRLQRPHGLQLCNEGVHLAGIVLPHQVLAQGPLQLGAAGLQPSQQGQAVGVQGVSC